MTVKELLKQIQQEKFDIKNTEVVVDDGTKQWPVESVNLLGTRVVLTLEETPIVDPDVKDECGA